MHLSSRAFSGLALSLLVCACRSPLADLPRPAGPFRLEVPSPALEDHSRNLRLLREPAPGEANTPEARGAALEAHRLYFEAAFRRRAESRGLLLAPEAPCRLELRLTSLGEVRTKYIVYGILGGVAWGVGTGLATHNPRLALGLGGYELVEESFFWIAGSSLFGRFSAPVVLEAALYEGTKLKPVWSETYYVIAGGKRLKAYPRPEQGRREVQLHASLDRALDKLFQDLEQIPGFPKAPEGPAALP